MQFDKKLEKYDTKNQDLCIPLIKNRDLHVAQSHKIDGDNGLINYDRENIEGVSAKSLISKSINLPIFSIETKNEIKKYKKNPIFKKTNYIEK